MKRSKYSFHDFSAKHTPSATLINDKNFTGINRYRYHIVMSLRWNFAMDCVRRRASSFNIFSRTGLLSKSELNLVYSICRVRRQETINFMTSPNFKKFNNDVFRLKSSSLFLCVDQMNRVYRMMRRKDLLKWQISRPPGQGSLC